MTEKLIAGYHQFYQHIFTKDSDLYKNLSQGQSPETLMIACCDSRVDPAIVTQSKPGDIFTVRNVANLVPPYDGMTHGLNGVKAAIEFAVRALKVKNIIVMGHGKCGGVKALMESDDDKISDFEFIPQWMDIAKEAKSRVHALAHHGENHEQLLHSCEKEVILLSLKNLMTYPWICDAVQQERLELHGWHFSIFNGELLVYDRIKKAFISQK